MDQMEILIEGNEVPSWRRRCDHRVESLKAKVFLGQDPPSQHKLVQDELFGEKNFVIFKLQKAVQNGNVDGFVDVLEQECSENKLPLSAILDQVTRAGDSLLHEAAYFGSTDIAELIIHHFPEILSKRNMKGDTALHVAARAKSSGVIKLILSRYHAHQSISSTGNQEGITRMTNDYGNTALHEAVYSKYLEGATLLFDADKYVALYLNKLDQSPLYLAVLTSNKEIVDVLLEVTFPDDKPLQSGISPLHAAIYTKNADLLKEIVEKRSEVMFLRDEYGGTPLHYAAATGYLDGVRMLLKKAGLSVLEWDTEGYLPIHLACKWGHIEVLKEFLELKWADPKILLNKKGQNILHVAVENGQDDEVKYLSKNTKLDLINEKDKDGNTPLHLAAANFYPRILFYLTQDKKIDVNLANNEGLTAKDTLLEKSQTQLTRTQRLSYLILTCAGAKSSYKAERILHNRPVTPPHGLEKTKDRMNTLMLVAILIVTVTFAAGFTVPGGVYSSDNPNDNQTTHNPNSGMAVLANRIMFKIFVLFNTVAMYSSTFGSFLLLWAQLGDFHLAVKSFNAALYMVGLALLTMTLAFMAAVSLIVSHVPWLAIVVTVIGIIFFLLILSFWILEVFYKANLQHVLPLVSGLVVRVLILFYRSTPKVKAH